MSKCDTCHAPGSCCRSMVVNVVGRPTPTFWAPESEARVEAQRWLNGHGLRQFRAGKVYRTFTDRHGSEYMNFRYSCTWLGDDGRCTNYEERPELCRSYQPMQDEMCAEYVGPPVVLWLEVQK